MKLAIMQPYFFPYIGYFQLINVVDKFVFYDDVNYIKNGWINRNRISINKRSAYLTVQLKKASSYKPINQTEFNDNRPKLLKKVRMAYNKAPYFDNVFSVVEQCMNTNTNFISELAIISVQEICKYLDINTSFEKSSTGYSETKPLERTERILSICRTNKADTYINAIGGVEIYSKDDFLKNGIELLFIKPGKIVYRQHDNLFQPWLSIIDVLMFNDITKVRNMLNEYSLV